MSTKEKGVAIRVERVRKGFSSGQQVFEGLDLQVAPGEFLSLIGPSGCGKSTLLRLLAGLESADAGEVLLSPAPRTGFVFQESHLLPWRTVYENVGLPLELQRVCVDQRPALISGALEQVGMAKEKALYPSQLSGGMKMRVSLARALVTSPSLLLLDEPFAALDELSRVHLEEELRRLWSLGGMTIVFVTHSFSEAVFLSDRIVLLSGSRKREGDSLRVELGERTQRLRSTSEFSALVQDCRRRFELLNVGAR